MLCIEILQFTSIGKMYKSFFDQISHYKNRREVVQVLVFDFTGRYTLLSVSTASTSIYMGNKTLIIVIEKRILDT